MIEQEVDAHVGMMLRQRREAVGLSQIELGQRVGVSGVAVCKWESGQASMRAGKLVLCAKVLDVRTEYFLPASQSTGRASAVLAGHEGIVFDDDVPLETTSERNASRSSASRAKLLDVAYRLFSTRGYDNVTTREIVEAAGLAPPTLYRHFGDKAGLWTAAMGTDVQGAGNLTNRSVEITRALRRLHALHRTRSVASEADWKEAWVRAEFLLPPATQGGRPKAPEPRDAIIEASTDVLRHGDADGWGAPTFDELSEGFTELCRLLLARQQNTRRDRDVYHQCLKAAGLALRAGRYGVAGLSYAFSPGLRRRTPLS